MKFSYYPGCSLHGSSKEYDISTQAICRYLDIELQELPDWICCGASSGHSINEMINIGLPAQNLKIAEKTGMDMAVPCAACYNRLKVADYTIREKRQIKEQIKEIIDYDLRNDVKIFNLIEIIYDRVGLEKVQSKVVKPLKGLKTACYYGCLLVRPADIMQFDDTEHPKSLDEIMKSIGAETMEWSFKTECCGGSLSLTRDDIVSHLVDRIIDTAKEAGAETIVTACPLCMENLEMRQSDKQFPIFYFTELLGLAFGLKESKHWINKHMINPSLFIKSLGLME
jgi:heterodisulfide reductase subunit B